MSGIVGIDRAGKQADVERMLKKISYRGQNSDLVETQTQTLGGTWSLNQTVSADELKKSQTVWDYRGEGQYAHAGGSHLTLKRDPLGVAPLYYGWTDDGALCFASEVKALLDITRKVHELPPGHVFDGENVKQFFKLDKKAVLKDPPNMIANELRSRFENVVQMHTQDGEIGSWLSGGIDSSLLAAVARQYTDVFHTFTAGLPGAPDVEYAQIVADHIQSKHHALVVTLEDLLDILPDVIYHLESFDAWLVRSSILNYLVAKISSDYVPTVISGEGGDELFAGYEYLKSLDPSELGDELLDITSQLHNTALQRVDRCASAHGIVAQVIFLNPSVVDYAIRIPPEYKLKAGVEKWILRQSIFDSLPDVITNRGKAKFWEGAGIEDLLADHAEQQISDADFSNERRLSNGTIIKNKEELYYYRIFKEHFGEFDDLGWMGRTKGIPLN